MGVTHLWTVLEPAGVKQCLSQLAGCTVAIDLSGWLYESERAKDLAGHLAKPHLRNLFYRISHLLRHQIKAVIVIEGKPSPLKKAELERRNIHNQKYGSGAKKYSGESVFWSKVEECCQLLGCLGVPFVYSEGEAEATCAVLNQEKVVDACITNDSDTFLYGGQTVYRNFTGNSKERFVDSYSMNDIKSKLGLDRKGLVAMALLMGCDYKQGGVHSIGKQQATQLVTTLKDVDILSRLESWRTDACYDVLEGYKTLKKPAHCGQCRHPGAVQTHKKNGCTTCCSKRGCNNVDTESPCVCECEWHKKQKECMENKLELSIRKKALVDPKFPDQEVIKEFLEPAAGYNQEDITWQRLDVDRLQEFSREHMRWTGYTTMKNCKGLLTIWDMVNMRDNKEEHQSKPGSIPYSILKTKQVNFQKVYEVQWAKIEGLYLPDGELITDEDQMLFKACFPDMVKKFESEQEEKKSAKKTSTTKKPKRTKLEEEGKSCRKLTDMFRTKKKKLEFGLPNPAAGTSTEDTLPELHPPRGIVEHEVDDGQLGVWTLKASFVESKPTPTDLKSTDADSKSTSERERTEKVKVQGNFIDLT